MIKKLWMTGAVFLAAFIALWVGVPIAFAQGTFVPLVEIPGLTKGAVANSQGLVNFLQNLYKYLIGAAATLAVIEIIWGGVEIASKDSVPMKMIGKERVYKALIGLALVLSPVLVFTIINPRILDLSIGLTELPTKPRPADPSGPLPTQPSTLRPEEKGARESSGGKVISTFKVSAGPVPAVLKTLDAAQVQCTQESGGTGVILAAPNVVGGGQFNYVCQTCPAGTKPDLVACKATTKGPQCSGCK